MKKNCLLTRFPIGFLHGRKNLFNFRTYWRGLPEFFSSYGYQTFEFAVPWRGSPKIRTPFLLQQIRNVAKRFDRIHLFVHSEGAEDVRSAISKSHQITDHIQTLTFIEPQILSPKETSGLLTKSGIPHGTLKVTKSRTDSDIGPEWREIHSLLDRSQLLQHCIFLAEYDLTTSK